MAEPAKPLPDMTDEEEGWLTDGEKDSGAAISDYRAGEQRNVSDQSGKEAQCNVNEEADHGSSCEKVGHFSDSDDFKEKAEIFHDAIMAKGSDTCREKGNRLFKEKKVGLQSYTKGSRKKTLPKAKRTRGLSSAYQNNFLCHIKDFAQILIKFHLQNIDQASTSKSQPNNSLSIKLKLQNLDQT